MTKHFKSTLRTLVAMGVALVLGMAIFTESLHLTTPEADLFAIVICAMIFTAGAMALLQEPRRGSK